MGTTPDVSVALTYNDGGNFRDQWVRLKINPDSACVFTRGIQTIELPVRHGEGKFYAESETLNTLTDNHQVVIAICHAGRPVGQRRLSPQPQRFPG